MATFLNSIGSGGQQVTTGERWFGERLRTLLEEDYLCWYDVPVGPVRQHRVGGFGLRHADRCVGRVVGAENPTIGILDL